MNRHPTLFSDDTEVADELRSTRHRVGCCAPANSTCPPSVRVPARVRRLDRSNICPDSADEEKPRGLPRARDVTAHGDVCCPAMSVTGRSAMLGSAPAPTRRATLIADANIDATSGINSRHLVSQSQYAPDLVTTAPASEVVVR